MINRQRPQSRQKNDHIELFGLLDKCSQIVKDDRLLLRQQLKDGEPDLLALFKKKPDLHTLQLELRKHLNKIKGRFQQQFQQQIYKTQQPPQKENVHNSQQHSFLAHYNRIESQKQPLQEHKQLTKKTSQNTFQSSNLKKHTSPGGLRSPQFKPRPTVSPAISASKPTKSATKTVQEVKQQISFTQENQVKLRQEFSPRFNIEQCIEQSIDTETNKVDPCEFSGVNQQEIENSRTQLEIFELKINEYSKGNNPVQSLWGNECYSQHQSPSSKTTHRKNDTSIFEVKQSQPNFGQNLRFQSKPEFQEDSCIRGEINFETFNATKKDNRFNCVLASFQNVNSSCYEQLGLRDQQVIERLETSQSNILDQEQSTQKDDRHIQDFYLEKQFEQSQSVIINPQSSHKEYSNNSYAVTNVFQESQIRKIEINEDDIMKKYANLFTAPEFLQQCKNSIQSFQSQQNTTQQITTQQTSIDHHFNTQQQQEFDSSRPIYGEYNANWNFIVPCQSVLCQNSTGIPSLAQPQNWDYLNENRCLQVSLFEQPDQPVSQDLVKWAALLQGIEAYSAEQIFDEIFSENSLNKISRAFFRFKMEGLVQSFKQNDLSAQQLDELFHVVDSKGDGFVDVNEMGTCLVQLCAEEPNNLIKVIFEALDQDEKGFFTKLELEDYLSQIQEHCEVSNIDNLVDLSKIFFNECDLLQNNLITYWEFYLKYTYHFHIQRKSTESCQRIIDVIGDYMEQVQRLQ